MPRRILSGTAVMLALAAGATYAATGGLLLGPASTAKARAFKAYYDGHKDTFRPQRPDHEGRQVGRIAIRSKAGRRNTNEPPPRRYLPPA
jgi:hypothetical protein